MDEDMLAFQNERKRGKLPLLRFLLASVRASARALSGSESREKARAASAFPKENARLDIGL